MSPHERGRPRGRKGALNKQQRSAAGSTTSVATITLAEAHAELERRFTTATTPGMHHEPNHEPSAWLRQRVNQLLADPGPRPGCLHVSPFSRGAALPIVLAMWAEALYCGLCSHLARLDPDDPQDRTCDRCGTHRPDGVHPELVLAGHLLVAFGLCGDCHRREMAS